MKQTATVKIFLAHGDPDSVRTAEISNWSGKAVAGPRSQLDTILQREEAGKPGIYFLTGINPESGKQMVYVGEAEIIRSRIKGHLERDFWKTILFFVSKDENLTKAHIKYLEGGIIELARSAGRYEVANANSSGSHLPEADAADMEVYLEKVLQLLPVLGQDFLKPIVRRDVTPSPQSELVCETKGVKARGRQSEDGFVVMSGSEAVKDERPSVKRYPYPSILRKQLASDGVLFEKDGKLIFTTDYEFTSPSAAASVIQGGHANGLIFWKTAKGVTLKEMEEKKSVQPGNAGDV